MVCKVLGAWYIWLGLCYALAGLGGRSILGPVYITKFSIVLLFLRTIIFVIARLLIVKVEALLDILFS